MNIQEKIDSYKAAGYKPVEVNKSSLGTKVLYKDIIVVRIGIDSAYDHYANLIDSGVIKSENSPKIFKHEKPNGSFGTSSTAYSSTEMELLSELTEEEALKYEEWINREIKDIAQCSGVNSDPFGVLDLTKKLIIYAQKNKLGLDLVQAKNVMKRSAVYVHIDPFGLI